MEAHMVGEQVHMAVPSNAIANFLANREQIVRETAVRSLTRTAVSHHGEDAYRLLAIGLDFTTQALTVAMQLANTSILDQQLEWANEHLRHQGISAEQMICRFELLADVVRETLNTPDAQAINRYVEYLIFREAELAIAHRRVALERVF